jgi:DNA-binding response OmpR family regulator
VPNVSAPPLFDAAAVTGADAYLVKPFGARELLAHVSAQAPPFATQAVRSTG